MTADELRGDVAEVLGCPASEIPADADLLDLGLDSVRIMSLVERWRRAGATGLEFADLAEDPRIERWVDVVSA
jgi:aryl carrier-like protein